jgi:UMF1 family MFS transporter
MYDFGNSAFFTTIVSAVFPVYFAKSLATGMDPAQATQTFGLITTIGSAALAVMAPLLGAMADYTGSRKRWLLGFMVLGCCATAGLFFAESGMWQVGGALFVLGQLGAFGTLVFYDALLPHVARDDEVDRVSTAAYALGYIGGGLLLAAQLAWIKNPEWFGLPTDDPGLLARLAFVSVAIWWALFSIPLFRKVGEPPAEAPPDDGRRNAVAVAFLRFKQTLRDLRGYPHAFVLLLAFLVYSDGIGTVIRMAAIFATELKFDEGVVIGALLLTQFVGIPFAFLFGMLAGKIGPKRCIQGAIVVYVICCLFASQMREEWHLYALAVGIATVQGGAQALSRSLFASMIPRNRSAQFFGFFAVCEKVAGIVGPLVFTLVAAVSGSSRIAVLAIVSFFVLGGWLLSRVDVAAGRAAINGGGE